MMWSRYSLQFKITIPLLLFSLVSFAAPIAIAQVTDEVPSLPIPESQSADNLLSPIAQPERFDHSEATPATHGIVYDQGLIFRPFDVDKTPFELKINLQNQFRHTGFANDESQVINSAGNVVPTPPRNTFDINRGRLILSGYALDPSLEYYANFDYNTVSENQFQLLMGWIRQVYNPAFNVSYGIGKVPGSWEWMEAARFTLGSERSLATTYFRPSLTAGIWADGELSSGLHYQALIGNGFNTSSLRSAELDTNFVYSAMLWADPLGDFGAGFSDFDMHEEAVVRFGTAFSFNRQEGAPTGEPGPEQTLVRISDGTLLVETGALAPGVTVERFDLSLCSVHAGYKHHGFSLAGEYYFRWLTDIRADGAIPVDSIFDHGFYAQAATFLRPESIELFARGSLVSGPYGDGSEFSSGFNWYVCGRRNQRFTFDVARIDNSPAQQDRTGFMAGASGMLFRTQVWVYF